MAKPLGKKPQTIKQWLDKSPERRVTRSELLRVIEGMHLLNKPELIEFMQEYEKARRARAWWRCLWRWFKTTIYERRTLQDLTPEQRERVRQELDETDG